MAKLMSAQELIDSIFRNTVSICVYQERLRYGTTSPQESEYYDALKRNLEHMKQEAITRIENIENGEELAERIVNKMTFKLEKYLEERKPTEN